MTCHGKRLFLLFLPLFLFLLCLLPMVACKEEEPAPPPAAEQLPPPENVRSDMGLLRWDEVEHADGYCVRINDGEALFTETNTCEVITLPAQSTHHIQVWAKGDGEAYADSDWVPFTYRLDDYPAGGYDENGLLYRLTGDKRGYEVSKGKSALVGTIDIRDEVFGLPVLRIAEGAFTPAEGEGETEPRTGTTINVVTTGVHLPDRLESVGAGAFQALTRLEEVVLPDSVTELGRGAFMYCKRLGRVVFPKSLREIPDACFAYCGLEELNLPEGLERIGKSAFAGTVLWISSGGGSMKWPNTQRFTKVIFPASVKSIGLDAFQGCEQLELVSLPQGLTEQGRGAFSGCTSLKEVIVPEGITFIGEGAFSYCSSLKEVRLPATVTEFRERAFYACEALEVLRLPAALETLESRALAGTRVKELILPASLKQFDSSVISSCDVLHSIWYEGTLSQWQARNFPLEKNGKIGNKSTPYVVDVFFYSAEKPESGGNYWHYVDGKPARW